jgi:protoporphyrinogen oxidase
LKPKIAVIIGAGPAGLTAAYELLTTTDYLPVIIEADTQVGGLSKTVDYKGNKIDIGGHRFFSKSERVLAWWLNFLPLKKESGDAGIKIHYQNKETEIPDAGYLQDGDKVMFLRPRKSRILFQKKFFDYPLKLNLKTIKNLGVIKLARAGLSYIYARLFPYKEEKNLAQFFRNRFGKELYLTFFKDYTEKVWGVSCEDIPAEWGKQRIKDLSVSKVFINAFKTVFVKNKSITQKGTSTSLIEQFLYPKYGPGQMWETVAEEVVKLGGRILYNKEVTVIQFDETGSIRAVESRDILTNEKEIIEGDVFFSTMPIRAFISGSRGIKIPENIIAIAAGLQYRDFLIVGLLIDKLLAEQKTNCKEIITDNWIYLQDKGIKAGRLQIFNNWSPFMISDTNKTWIGVEFFCNENEFFWQQNDEEIIAHAKKEMDFIGLIDAKDVEDAVVLKVLKAYPSYYGLYSQFDDVKNWLNGIANLYCIGRNGMHKYNNSDHSMLTAMEAVHHLKAGGDKLKIWDINTEDDYHEEK